MSKRDEIYTVTIERLRSIHDHEGRVAAIQQICDKAFLPFAESEMQFFDPANVTEEADAHILALHEGAFTLRGQCDSLLGSKAAEESQLAASFPKIMDAFADCRARLENIYILRRPDLLAAVDAVL